MAVINPYMWANKTGIPRLEATGVTVGTDNITFSFNPHAFLSYPFLGLILFKLPSYTAPTTAVPIVFNTNGKTQALTTMGGTAVTSAEVNEAGIYLAVYDSTTGTLQLIAPKITTTTTTTTDTTTE